MSIELFVFNEDIGPLYHELIELQQRLCNPASFDCLSRWINYYTVALTSIFKKFSLVDHTVSASCDIYFQTPTQQFFLAVDKPAQ
ncbi:MAG: hypothetical protein EOO69_12880 [Moraxellaceae bacterium]|nr:MAG: hypothetical protein EOO69_12880 [Moraxellaceae bacterium]